MSASLPDTDSAATELAHLLAEIAAAGSLRQKDRGSITSRPLRLLPHDWGEVSVQTDRLLEAA